MKNKERVCIICNGIIGSHKSKSARYCSYVCWSKMRRLKPKKRKLKFCVDCGKKLKSHAISRCYNCYQKALHSGGRSAYCDNSLQYSDLKIWQEKMEKELTNAVKEIFEENEK